MPFTYEAGLQSTPQQLAQNRPANTTAASLYSPADGIVSEITHLVICNTSGASAKARVFHDDDGTTYSEVTSLYWDIAVAADTSVEIDVAIYMSNSSGNLAIRSDTADALTFTAYGLETRIRAR